MDHLVDEPRGGRATGRLGRVVADNVPFVVASALCVLAIVMRWRGPDLPAQVFRANLVRHHGLIIWNAMWYGGHSTLSYSVITPVLGALLGPVTVTALSGIAAAVLFQRMAEAQFGTGARLATVWFAVGTVMNLVMGRAAFAVGLAFALAAIAGLQAKHDVLAAAAAAAAALASPVAAVGVAIAGTAVVIMNPGRRTRAALVVAAAVLPVAVLTVVFPDSGSFPYPLWALLLDLAVIALVVVAMRRDAPVVAVGAALYGAVELATFLVPSPLGANISRFGQFFAWPLLACAMRGRSRVLLAALAVPMLLWLWAPAIDAMTVANHDPSTKASYYQPLVAAVRAQAVPGGRLEIPFTRRHWETAYVASDVPLARGWERQLDMAYNPAFYHSGGLNADTFHAWLTDNAVQFVALPDTALDVSSEEEAALLRSGLPYLQPVWSDGHWRLWRVTDFKGLVDGHATVTSMDERGVALQVSEPGTLLVRVRKSSHWSASGGACVSSDPSGWIKVSAPRSGPVLLTQAIRGTPC
jgi:hypothetical protein